MNRPNKAELDAFLAEAQELSRKHPNNPKVKQLTAQAITTHRKGMLAIQRLAAVEARQTMAKGKARVAARAEAPTTKTSEDGLYAQYREAQATDPRRAHGLWNEITKVLKGESIERL